MGFWNNLLKDYKCAKIYVDANKNPFSKEAREMRRRRIMNLDLETGKPYLEMMDANERNARIKNLRNTMEKYNIEHPDTIESIEAKIDETSIKLKNASSKEERTYLLRELDYYYDKLDELNKSNDTKETDRNMDTIR